MIIRWWKRMRKRTHCFHHDHSPGAATRGPRVSWINSQLIDCGMRKMFWCTGCGKTWIP